MCVSYQQPFYDLFDQSIKKCMQKLNNWLKTITPNVEKLPGTFAEVKVLDK
jgi:hypothetical protein